MKCNKCGANYDSALMECPFCGEINQTGVQWEKEKNSARNRLNTTKQMVIQSAPLYVMNRVLNAILIIMLVVAIVGILVLAVLFWGEEKLTERRRSTADYDYALSLYQNEEFDALDDYMDEHEIDASVEGYAPFIEAIILDHEYDDFMEGWMYFEERCNQDYNSTSYSSYSAPNRMLRQCEQFLTHNSYRCRADYEENLRYSERLEAIAILFLKSEFGYTDQEIATYFKEFDLGYDEFEDRVIRDAFRRKGWEFYED